MPFGLTVGPTGDLFFSSDVDEILQFSGADGSFIRVFVQASDNGGLLDPRGMVFKGDGNLVVASFSTNKLLEFDGDSGAFVGQFDNAGTSVALTLDGPWSVRVGVDGDIYANRHFENTPQQAGGSRAGAFATRGPGLDSGCAGGRNVGS